MRIIGGTLRHRYIKLPTTRETRATKDAVREAVFSALGSHVSDRLVLDLFAGSGAYGLEAVSRGAKRAILADHNDICINTIRENIAKLGVANAEAWLGDYLDTLKKLTRSGTKIDLLFLDPPYFDKICEEVIAKMVADDLLTETAIIVCETHKDIIVDEATFAKVKRYKYGITHVTIIWRQT